MNRTIVEGDWNKIKGKAKQAWGNLTDDDLIYEEGKDDEMIGRLQRKTGEAKEAIRQKIDEWLR